MQFMGREEPPRVNVNKCVNYICGGKSSGIFQQSFIQQFINERVLIAEGDSTIDPLDPLTWQDHDRSCLQEGNWNCIGQNLTYQQTAKNLIQTANHLAKTSHGNSIQSLGQRKSSPQHVFRKYMTAFAQKKQRNCHQGDEGILCCCTGEKAQPEGNDLTPYVNIDGAVASSYLNEKNGSKPYFLTELDFCDQKK